VGQEILSGVWYAKQYLVQLILKLQCCKLRNKVVKVFSVRWLSLICFNAWLFQSFSLRFQYYGVCLFSTSESCILVFCSWL